MDRDPSERLRRAIKENNLLLVRRLLSRTDMRNPDPGPGRYTSLAWAALCVCEETFEYLLGLGHDDDELTRDNENNTILILLAGVKGGPADPHCRSSLSEHEVKEAVLRMARLYYDRYPFLIDWANVQGKTALHVAALKGNEEFVKMFCDLGADFDLPDTLGNTPLHYASSWGHVQIVQLLIEKGCQFAAKNNQGFTASDYAYSYSTMSALQETARMLFEHNKRQRRQVFAQAAARGAEARKKGWESDVDDRSSTAQKSRGEVDRNKALPRLRSGSGATSTSDSATDQDASGSSQTALSSRSNIRPHQSSLSSDNSSQPSPLPISSTSLVPPAHHNRTTSSASAAAVLIHPSTSSNSSFASPIPPAPPPKGVPPSSKPPDPAESALSPVVMRMRERDADAMAQYLKQNPVTSNGKDSATSSVHTSQGSLAVLASSSKKHSSPNPRSESPKPPPSEHQGLSFPSLRLLRPSISAASLRSMNKMQASATKKPAEERSSRFRSTTLEQLKPSGPPPKDPLPSIPSETEKASIDLPTTNGSKILS